MSSTACKPIRVAGLVGDSITDGPGLRLTVFVQGCPHRCEGCHNPQTWPFAGGTWMQPEEIFQKLRQNPLSDGMTLSGGEPFCQCEALLPLAKQVRAAGYSLYAYTGYTFEALYRMEDPFVRKLLQQLNVLVDGPFLLSQRNLTLPFRGSENQRILDVPRSLAAKEAVWTDDADWFPL